MSGVCGEESKTPTEQPTTRLWRNGMDFEPKKTYPPDYSNVPSVRDWQMSPFGNERYDLDMIQRAEKKGFKGRFELERIKKELAELQSREKPPKPEQPPCPVCQAREAEEKEKEKTAIRPDCKDYNYKPYGPTLVSSLSYSCPETNNSHVQGPVGNPRTQLKYPTQMLPSLVPCPSYYSPSPRRDFSKSYAPYGNYEDLRFKADMYIPMGPAYCRNRK